PPPAPAPTPSPVPPPPVPVTPPSGEVEVLRQARLVERITFGPTPQLVAEVAAMGSDAFLEWQLSIPPAGTAGVLTGAHTLDASIGQRYQATRDANPDRTLVRELRHAAVVRAVTHPGQLAELMVDFWTNHFSVYAGNDDKDVKYAVASDDRDVIRPHALGRFADLLLANARSVSMLLYLDNFRSTATRPNQNYARELVELHTMGAFNGYDEDDVDALARVFSGWSLAGRLRDGDDLRYVFDPARHFSGPITIDITDRDGTVHTWSTEGATGPEGEADGIAVIAWLARLPNTARFIAEKLVRRFVADEPPTALVESAAQVYLANDTEIVPVLRHILTSAELDATRRSKVRTPFELLVAMLRAVGASIDRTAGGPAAATLSDQVGRLGQELWSWPTPDGFPDDRHFWITTNTTLRRWELAARVGNGRLTGVGADIAALVPSPLPATVGEVITGLAARLGVGISETSVSAIAQYLGTTHDAPTAEADLARRLGDTVGLLFCSPAFQHR
ncbi:MAG TPA: DUF1800 domain-containing protein, partial [Acidimicrobiales bacterium]|nr:DUF1800 domain-containing protein [Acidimicrobiales bacterium]